MLLAIPVHACTECRTGITSRQASSLLPKSRGVVVAGRREEGVAANDHSAPRSNGAGVGRAVLGPAGPWLDSAAAPRHRALPQRGARPGADRPDMSHCFSIWRSGFPGSMGNVFKNLNSPCGDYRCRHGVH